MKFSEVVTQTLTWLQREGRISYRALRLEFDLNEDALDALKEEIIEAKRVASDENGKVLVWVGSAEKDKGERITDKGENLEQEAETARRGNGEMAVASPQHPTPSTQSPAERRQLTVMFCDLVGSTALSAQLDPEDYRAVVQRYQQTCTTVIQRHEGYIAQYLGDGLLVYFGYPSAHEDDALRAVRAGLEIVTAVQSLAPSPALMGEGRGEGHLQIRIGIHTGIVVIGDIGTSGRTEQLALGETPNVAARIQSLAEPNTVIISAATQRLIESQFECPPLGSHLVKGIETPIAVYHVQSERHDISPLAGRTSLTPLVGREQEVGLLVDRWEQVKEGRGQVVLLSGEPGIGKSRLAYTLREHVTREGSLLFEARCSPYHQHSALYPLIDVLQRTLLFTRQDADDEKITNLERALALYDMQESLPLFTALLSLPTPSQYPPLNLTPQKQKERTLQALVQLLIAQAERQATVSVWEDLHWADPSSLEFLSLLIEQLPTTKLLLVLTFRPEFTPPWKPRSHISQLVLNRLGKKQVEAMIEKVAADKGLSADVIEQIRMKTDGVPLFVEELTKNVIESVESIESIGSPHHTLRQLAIPATLQEALLARLDRLSTARQIAQLGATLGREFSYELLHAVAPTSEADLQSALFKLVEAEILYQRGVGEQARYFFKHALIQDTAYQSLLKSTRQQYHQQIAHILEERFPDTKANQPELLAHHYSEAGLIEQAIPYWQQAGQQAVHRSANVEAISHLSKALELLNTLPDTPKRSADELSVLLLRAVPLIATQGYSSSVVRNSYERARELSEHVTDMSQLFRALWGMALFHTNAGENRIANRLIKKCMELAEQQQNPSLLLQAHFFTGALLHWFGKLSRARAHLKRATELYEFERDRSLAFVCGVDPGMASLAYGSLNLWYLGYPDQALKQTYAAVSLAERVAHPLSHCFVQSYVALVHFLRGEARVANQQALELARLAEEQLFQHYRHMATLFRGFTLVEQGSIEEGEQLALTASTALRNAGASGERPFILSFLAEVCRKAEHFEEGLHFVNKGIRVASDGEEMQSEAELYRLKGELTLQKEARDLGLEASPSSQAPSLKPLVSSGAEQEAEGYFLKAIDTARKQQAKSLELRASTSLARLWQSQGKQHAACNTLSEIYNWFTEGFDTKDLQEAKALIEGVSRTLD